MFSMFLDFYSKKKAVPGRNSLRVFADLDCFEGLHIGNKPECCASLLLWDVLIH